MKRDKCIDIAKGIAMLLVILGHSQFANHSFKVFIYSFHMPLFFFLSGMVFSYKKYKSFFEFLKSKMKSLLLPYFTIGTLIIVLKNLSRIYIEKNLVGSLFWSKCLTDLKGLVVANRHGGVYYSFWFILTLFLASILSYFIIKAIEKRKHQSLMFEIVILILFILQVIVFRYVKAYYWSFDIVPIASVFILFGYLAKKNIDKVKTKLFNIKNIYAYIIIMVLLVYINYRNFGISNIFHGKMGYPVIFIITSLLGISLVMSISYKIEKSKVLEYIGRNTFTYYFFQEILVLVIVDYIIWKFSQLTNIFIPNSVKVWIQMYLACIMLYVISFIINKYLPFLYGRRREYEKK